jgi:hypothetical protein
MSNVSNSNLLSSLLPTTLIGEIEKSKVNEKTMLAVAALVSGVVSGAVKAWKRGQIKEFDPNPGDGGCQLRGYLLYLFSSDATLREESATLYKNLYKDIKNAKKSSDLFADFKKTELSKKMEFLLQCYLLQVTRAVSKTLPNGIVVTKSDCTLLSQLSGRISSDEYIKIWRKKIVDVAQSNISANSVELLRCEANKLTPMDPTGKDPILNKDLILKMLSQENTSIYAPPPRTCKIKNKQTTITYDPKTFGCLFYEYKAILFRLREEKGLVCFKSIVPSGLTPFWILLQPREENAEFSIIPDDAYRDFLKSPMVVFEGVVNAKYDKNSFSKKITEIGFTELILATAAIEPPYERSSKLDDITNVEAKDEIERYIKKAETNECQKKDQDSLLILDHVYCNLLQAEIGAKV